MPVRGGYVRAADGEKVEIVWQRGHDPVFELFRKSDGKVVKTVPLAGLFVADIERLLASHGFLPHIPSTNFRVKIIAADRPAHRSVAVQFLKDVFAGEGGYTRAADGEKVEVEWRGGFRPVFQLRSKHTGKLVEEVHLDHIKDSGEIEALLFAHGYRPAGR